jgi:hypothetical protein
VPGGLGLQSCEGLGGRSAEDSASRGVSGYSAQRRQCAPLPRCGRPFGEEQPCTRLPGALSPPSRGLSASSPGRQAALIPDLRWRTVIASEGEASRPKRHRSPASPARCRAPRGAKDAASCNDSCACRLREGVGTHRHEFLKELVGALGAELCAGRGATWWGR